LGLVDFGVDPLVELRSAVAEVRSDVDGPAPILVTLENGAVG
jgi:hypothetical protein